MSATYPYDLTAVVVNPRVGQVEPHKPFTVREVPKNTGVGTDFSVGAILMHDATNGVYIAATSGATRNFAVVNTKPATTDIKVNAILDGWVWVTAGGAIKPGNRVMCGGSDKVIAYDGTGEGKVFGTYQNKAGQDDMTHAVTDAANNDIILVYMTSGGD